MGSARFVHASVARVDVTLRGRPINLETNAPDHRCATAEGAMRMALERAQYLIDCREVSADGPAAGR
jgi:hypothetical protein